MQKDDLEIDLHALNLKLEQALPNYKTLQFQVEELTEQLENTQHTWQQAQQELELLRRQVTQTRSKLNCWKKMLHSQKHSISKLLRKWSRRKSLLIRYSSSCQHLQSQFSEQAHSDRKVAKNLE